MRNFIVKNMLLMDKVNDPAASGGKAFPVPPKAPEPTKEDPAPAPASGDKEFDELGYEKIPAQEAQVPGDKKQTGDQPPQAPVEKPEKVENPGTGYGDEEPKVDDEPPAPAPEPPKAPTDLEKKLEGFHESVVPKLKAQIEELGLESDKLDKFIAQKRQEQKEAMEWQKGQEAEMRRQDQMRRQAWHKELRDDPSFGGQKYQLNLSRCEKVLDEYLPELKKELTEAKQMLRPSVMRGLARLADAVYPERKMVHGDPVRPTEEADDKKGSDPLAFYE